MGPRARQWLTTLALLAAGRELCAQEAVRIEYSAPDDCPSAEEFSARVKQRVSRARFAEPGELARTFRVRVASRADKSVARVEFVDADGEKASRTIAAPTCDEVVNAIALATALAMDARAGEDEPEAAPLAAQEETAPAPPPPRAVAPARQPREHGARWDAGAGVDVASGFAPSLSAGLHVFSELTPSFWSVRWTALHADSGKVAVEGGRTRFRFWGGRAEGCPLSWAWEPLRLAPCAGLEAGALHGEGLPGGGIARPKETTELWLAGLVVGRVQLALDDFLLLEAQGDLRFPLTRHEFRLDTPERTIHDVPAVAFGASLGVGFRFGGDPAPRPDARKP